MVSRAPSFSPKREMALPLSPEVSLASSLASMGSMYMHLVTPPMDACQLVFIFLFLWLAYVIRVCAKLISVIELSTCW
ncbi:Superoxide dismutase [Zea mays]|uniref:Superoxide dismutase n=1 Tax=Zea mays TaxID=4577 RepID=A0A1D6PAB5_MAIZE|nr:Superoxide dismutase [Zea mays]AQL06671.1 Superoxide dismutase [Zea mays]